MPDQGQLRGSLGSVFRNEAFPDVVPMGCRRLPAKQERRVSGRAMILRSVPRGRLIAQRPVPAVGAIDPETGLRQPDDHRTCLHRSALARVTDISASPHSAPPAGHATSYQVALPYLGVFTYTVGRQTAVLDANRTLLVPAGVDFADGHPVANLGHASVVIVPSPEVLDEICRANGVAPERVFTQLSRPVSAAARLATHRLLMLTENHAESLFADELIVQVLQETLFAGAPMQLARSTRVVDRAKQVIHARDRERLSLDEIAREVGVSPVYLTQEFTRTEGLPLHRYRVQLRLGRALVELPHREDITGLALDLGFSSHSHFSSAFRRTFGLTPAEFRAWGARRRKRAVQPVATAAGNRRVAAAQVD